MLSPIPVGHFSCQSLFLPSALFWLCNKLPVPCIFFQKTGKKGNRIMDNWREERKHEDLTLSTFIGRESISHRKLSPAEAHAIWTILNPSSNPSSVQELRIVLKPEHYQGARGWVICTE
jgi:hypothetical protein